MRARKRRVRDQEAAAGNRQERQSRACAIRRREDATKGLPDPY